MNISAFNSKEIQPPNAEDAFVAAICPIRAISFAMMDAGWGLPTVGTESRNSNIAQKSYTRPLNPNGPQNNEKKLRLLVEQIEIDALEEVEKNSVAAE